MPLQNMFVLLLGLILVISGFYVAWNAPEPAPTTSTTAPFVLSVDNFDCDVGSLTVRAGAQTTGVQVVDADGMVLEPVGGEIQIPNWEGRRSVTVTYLWAGDPGSQVIDPANHCP